MWLKPQNIIFFLFSQLKLTVSDSLLHSKHFGMQEKDFYYQGV
jgi:hypothetical protein